MKNNELLKRLLKEFIVSMSLYMVGGLLLFLFLVPLYRANIYYGYEPIYRIVTTLYNNIGIVMLLYTFLGITIFFIRTLMKPIQYIDEISESFTKINDDTVDIIELSEYLKEIEFVMNKTKMDIKNNKQSKDDAEQKKNDLIVYLAHDIKTPLTSVIGYLSLLDEIKDMPELQRQRYIEIALDKSYKLEDLINELFDITRLNHGDISLLKEDVDLNLMMSQIIDDLYPTLTQQHKTIEVESSNNLSVHVDSNKMARVFNNVINNAITYSTKDSVITIKMYKNNEKTIIEIINQGTHISQELLNKMFEKFYRHDKARSSQSGGSGLGLAIAKEIVELHNGSITARSNDTETTFTIEL